MYFVEFICCSLSLSLLGESVPLPPPQFLLFRVVVVVVSDEWDTKRRQVWNQHSSLFPPSHPPHSIPFINPLVPSWNRLPSTLLMMCSPWSWIFNLSRQKILIGTPRNIVAPFWMSHKIIGHDWCYWCSPSYGGIRSLVTNFVRLTMSIYLFNLDA